MRKDHDEVPVLLPENDELHRGSVAADEKISGRPNLRFKLPKLKIKNPKKKIAEYKKVHPRRYKGILIVSGISSLLFLLFFVLPVISLLLNARHVRNRINDINAAVDTQDIGQIKSSVEEFKGDFNNLKGSYKWLGWSKYIPFVGAYYSDGEAIFNAATYGLEAGDIFIETIEPYADIIGFGGDGAEGATDANDRIEFLVQSIEHIIPRMDELANKSVKMNEELSTINPKRYPRKIGGREVRSNIKKYIEIASDATEFLRESKPLLEAAPYLLGIDETRTYLLLFQNDKELRPTGGFITAYSIIDIVNGKIQPGISSDIYKLDDKYTPKVEAPSVLKRYIRGPYLLSDNLYLRDMNWDPDFKDSIELFLAEAETAELPKVDGVIAVDTQVVVNLLDAIGAVNVPDFGVYSSDNDERCACPQVVYELESFADVEGPIVWSENEPGKIVFAPENYLNRKEIVGPLMNTILTTALGQPVQKMPNLFHAGWKSLTEKHVMFYLFDDKAQSGVEAFGIAGRVKDFDGDYLLVNDANLAGRKSNLYVTQEVSQDIEIENDEIIKTVTITYQNPRDYDGWLNSVLPNWTRIYIPQGSEVMGVEGFEDEGEVYEEHGKTVISGGFELRPLGVKKISIRYKLPFNASDKYDLLIQKQPGKDNPLYTININDKTEEFFLLTDREFEFEI
jgi:hypothetical protein